MTTPAKISSIGFTYLNVNNADPTKTTALRNAYAKDMAGRFDKLVKAIFQKVVTDDCFGLTQESGFTTNAARATFAFPRSQDKIQSFMDWLEAEQNAGILEVTNYTQVGSAIENAWQNKYIQDSYKRGVIRARYELDKAGFNVPSMESTGGIEMSMATPFHLDRVGVLYSRVFNELKGITSAMDQQISRVLSQGLVDGDNPRLLARKLIATINGKGLGDLAIKDTLGRFIPAARRAEMLARTEIIRAHHSATIQEYRNWGTVNVMVQGEWMTAQDQRVCSFCASMQGRTFTLDEIEKMIPAHTGCRCIALPKKIEEEVKVPIKRTK